MDFIVYILSGASKRDSDKGEAPIIPMPSSRTEENKGSAFDHQQFTELFNEFYAPLTLMANNFLGDHDLAEDVVMDIFCTLIERKESFNNVRDMKSYLYVSTRNRCYDHLRHRKVIEHAKRNLTDLFQAKQMTNSIDEMIGEVGLMEVINTLYQEIGKLPQNYREVLQLMFAEGKSLEEVATLLGKSYTTVAAIKSRALKKMKINISDFRS